MTRKRKNGYMTDLALILPRPFAFIHLLRLLMRSQDMKARRGGIREDNIDAKKDIQASHSCFHCFPYLSSPRYFVLSIVTK